MTSRIPRTSHDLKRGSVHRFWPLLLAPLFGLNWACSSDHLTRAQPAPQDSLYWALDLNHHAVTLSLQAPYDTLTLLATPRNVNGEPLGGLETPQYSSLDAEHVTVTPDGLLQAVALTGGEPVTVVATLMADNLRYADTVLVNVVADTVPKLVSVSIHPEPPDSAKTAVNLAGSAPFGFLRIRAMGSDGMPIDSPLVYVRSSDTSTAHVLRVFGKTGIVGHRLGTITLTASATVFGVVKTDTLPYQIGWPVLGVIEIRQFTSAAGKDSIIFDPPELWVGAGAAVKWDFKREVDTVTTEVLFAEPGVSDIKSADPSLFFWSLLPLPPDSLRKMACEDNATDCDGVGNISLPSELQGAFRVFPTPGTYEYRNLTGATGRIVVVDERD